MRPFLLLLFVSLGIYAIGRPSQDASAQVVVRPAVRAPLDIKVEAPGRPSGRQQYLRAEELLKQYQQQQPETVDDVVERWKASSALNKKPSVPSLVGPAEIQSEDVKLLCSPENSQTREGASSRIRTALRLRALSKLPATDADDATQDMMLKIMKACDLFLSQSDQKVQPYIFSAFQHLIIDKQRSARRTSVVMSPADEKTNNVAEGNVTPVANVEAKDILERLIQKLTPQERAVLEALIMELETTDIAANLNITDRRVRELRDQIRRKLSQLLLARNYSSEKPTGGDQAPPLQ